jgi:hypothetical protein
MRVRIYHSIDRDFMFQAWKPEALLKLVDDYAIEGWRSADPDERITPGIQKMGYREGAADDEILELVYRDQNAVDGSERNVMMRNRSLSVGDVVMLNDRAFAVASLGFEPIDEREMLVVLRDARTVDGRVGSRAKFVGNGRGYVSDEDEEKFDRLLTDPFGRDR